MNDPLKKTAVAFRASARTIDHLGKGQIADCPTAVSELWKNAFDAYARDVALHTFDGKYKTAAILDNGCGMTMQQLIDSWLVIGTNSKSIKKTLPDADRFGLALRQTQGEKGIGRLSSAFLAPVTLLVTKKMDSDYSVALIDWRLFENTYLSIEDIKVPLSELKKTTQLEEEFPSLLQQLKDNLCIADRSQAPSDSHSRIRNAWEKYSQDETDLAKAQNKTIVTTEEKIKTFCANFMFTSALLDSWQPLIKKVKELDGQSHGTALFLFDLERDLSLITNIGTRAHDNVEVKAIQADLVDTLRAFVDPFNQNQNDFAYEIKTFATDGSVKVALLQTDVFDRTSFAALEHTVVGSVDERGWFTGHVKAFGKDMGAVKIAPSIEIENTGTKVGSFELSLGTFEFEFEKSTHTEAEHPKLIEQAAKYSGLLIFRDSLRVLPYGRVENDFFEIEEKRSTNAGRYYWSKRRMFGQILITHSENSALKDKAGREGFIKNQAARELKSLVSSILDSLADRYFGGKSEDRQSMLALLKAEKENRKEAQVKAKRVTQKSFLEELRNKSPKLTVKLGQIKQLGEQLKGTEVPSAEKLQELDSQISIFERLRGELKTPIKPPKLGDNEDNYRLYRDMYNEFSAHLTSAKTKITKYESVVNARSPVLSAKRSLEKHQSSLNAQVNKHISEISQKLAELQTIWNAAASDDRSKFYPEAIEVVKNVEQGADLERSLNVLDSMYTSLSDSFNLKYAPLLVALDRLKDGVNLEYAFSMAEEEKAYFEDKAKSLQSLAQLGISVEIIAHELEELDAMVSRGLNSLPTEVKKDHPGFQTAFNAHKALTQQIRFLSPLKLSGYQARRDITGRDIEQHIKQFFGERFNRQRVEFVVDEGFKKIQIRDLPSRIFPVFVNILNNALYWVCLSEVRQIRIGRIGNEVIIANSGPQVDPDDIPRLFELFYSRRSNGHGVGLYLCKENLAVAHHKIRYSAEGDIQLIANGANFIITFNELETT
jgi:signal transduction histidine kinase